MVRRLVPRDETEASRDPRDGCCCQITVLEHLAWGLLDQGLLVVTDPELRPQVRVTVPPGTLTVLAPRTHAPSTPLKGTRERQGCYGDRVSGALHGHLVPSHHGPDLGHTSRQPEQEHRPGSGGALPGWASAFLWSCRRDLGLFMPPACQEEGASCKSLPPLPAQVT